MHRHITNPTVSKADCISVAAKELTEAIKGNIEKDISKLDMKELERLADIFDKAAKKVAENDAASPRVATQNTNCSEGASRGVGTNILANTTTDSK